ncbi:MAG: hypothetical protein H6983_02795 [Ectothiorhodospiraceae bacterium]|nr:hypothetical protein [Ectothiorhodospiraceae bacterium]
MERRTRAWSAGLLLASSLTAGAAGADGVEDCYNNAEDPWLLSEGGPAMLRVTDDDIEALLAALRRHEAERAAADLVAATPTGGERPPG